MEWEDEIILGRENVRSKQQGRWNMNGAFRKVQFDSHLKTVLRSRRSLASSTQWSTRASGKLLGPQCWSLMTHIALRPYCLTEALVLFVSCSREVAWTKLCLQKNYRHLCNGYVLLLSAQDPCNLGGPSPSSAANGSKRTSVRRAHPNPQLRNGYKVPHHTNQSPTVMTCSVAAAWLNKDHSYFLQDRYRDIGKEKNI